MCYIFNIAPGIVHEWWWTSFTVGVFAVDVNLTCLELWEGRICWKGKIYHGPIYHCIKIIAIYLISQSNLSSFFSFNEEVHNDSSLQAAKESPWRAHVCSFFAELV